jgi:hypothetical protein
MAAKATIARGMINTLSPGERYMAPPNHTIPYIINRIMANTAALGRSSRIDETARSPRKKLRTAPTTQYNSIIADIIKPPVKF